MASIPCTTQLHLSPKSSIYRSFRSKTTSPFLSITGRQVGTSVYKQCSNTRPSPIRRIRVTAWFKFGSSGVDAEGAGIYGSQSRDDFDRDDVEQYFNYMGMLAVEGTYDKMEALLNQKIHPIDILLMLAATESDLPKIEEVLRAGAKFDVKDSEGRTALDRSNDEIKEIILGFSVKKV